MTVQCSSFTDEPLPGTATQERGWLCIENNGGWGRDPFSGETFSEDVGGAIERFAERHDLRVLLIRRPGRATDFRSTRTVFVARSVAGETALRQFDVDDYAQIPELDLGDPDAGVSAGPVALVCTNGKRDVCCAVRGRPVAAALAGCYSDPVVWECSHTGGHRFAPVLITLPTGHTYGRVTAAQAKEVFDAARAGLVSPQGLRGRSSNPPIAQVAEVAVRNRIDACGADDLRVEVENRHVALVRHVDGRGWRVTAYSEDLPDRVASCGKSPSPARAWRVRDVIAARSA